MIDYKFVKLIETIGYVNGYGKHIYGTAALLHFLRCPVENINPNCVTAGKAYVKNLLSA